MTDATTEYHAGGWILYSGLPYQAKWNNQGIAPQSGTAASPGSPWQPLEPVPGEPTPSVSATTPASASPSASAAP